MKPARQRLAPSAPSARSAPSTPSVPSAASPEAGAAPPVRVRATVNGRPIDQTAAARTTLAGLLREQLGLYGTKLGCNEGTCGSCTVQVDGVPVYACMLLASDACGREVLTIEGLGTPEHPHALQSAFGDTYAAQCGYCTPGLILAAEALLRAIPAPDEKQVREALSGNLCKCAAYPEIVAAVLKAAKSARA